MLFLLHAIPPKLLHSIVRGTVAYDCARTRIHDHADEYPKTGPGIYVIGISINRDTHDAAAGSFLSAGEISKLSRCLWRYIEAYNIRKRLSPAVWNQDPKMRAAIDMAAEIDRQFRRVNKQGTPGRTLFIDSDSTAENVEALIKSLERRKPPVNSPDALRQAQHQSPLYVGCSDNLEVRLADYSLDRDLSRINKLLALTLSVIKYMGLQPKLTRKVVLRTWEPRQLPEAEKLVIALARSYCHMDGFNVADGGGKTPKDSYRTLAVGEEEVMRIGYFRKNMRKSLEEMDNRVAFLQNSKDIIESAERMQRKLKSMDAMSNDRKESRANLGLTHERMQRRITELEGELGEIESHNLLLEKILHLAKSVREQVLEEEEDDDDGVD
ncbi:hypothetical protein K4K49_012910 [Colletotrichum sp. SAR 10_70]|nr:hypothetical protein K4K50_006843 [Colletotrichum sp. SAR 10_71]KAI8166783.1 hypothetical protein KHU50_006668 [Colletotrichum sp. SAR 10_65]KAI8187731.1 hypothetical protein K4K51_008101 [Colletotrichum sp. SAR 10_75]KAI8188052.1 hypothetical protein K4K49_012910 [Colletotrichum sp. SAR 10_70]KAI8208525.1 hypothetical protein K4K52_001244 [Colletotrichum sp. SAR 10_76]KAI8248063.1 hypothetical protein K4K53_001141 [Colletotrichum sp. SAR 10_77]KAJ4996833.1 hypothetical protein K4K48_00779